MCDYSEYNGDPEHDMWVDYTAEQYDDESEGPNDFDDFDDDLDDDFDDEEDDDDFDDNEDYDNDIESDDHDAVAKVAPIVAVNTQTPRQQLTSNFRTPRNKFERTILKSQKKIEDCKSLIPSLENDIAEIRSKLADSKISTHNKRELEKSLKRLERELLSARDRIIYHEEKINNMQATEIKQLNIYILAICAVAIITTFLILI